MGVLPPQSAAARLGTGAAVRDTAGQRRRAAAQPVPPAEHGRRSRPRCRLLLNHLNESSMLIAVAVFVFTPVLVIWQPKGLGVGWSAAIGAAIALGVGAVSLQDKIGRAHV